MSQVPTRARLVALPACALLVLSSLPRTARAQAAPDDDVPSPRPSAPSQPAPPLPPPVPKTTAPPPAPRPAPPIYPGYPAYPGYPMYPPAPGYPLYPSTGQLDPRTPPPPRYRFKYEDKPMYSLMTAGLCVFGGTYLLSALFGGYATQNPGFYAPVIGPVLYKSSGGTEAALVFDTLVQGSGVAMALVGGLVKRKVAVREIITVVPMATPGGGGLAAFGVW